MDTSFIGSWHNAVLASLAGMGVSMSVFPEDGVPPDSFLSTKDVPSELHTILPAGTYAFAYGSTNDSFSKSDRDTFIEDYQSSQKRYYYHFVFKGVDFVLNLGFTKGGTVGLSVMLDGSGEFSSFTPSSVNDRRAQSSFVSSLLEAVVGFTTSNGAGSLDSNYPARETRDFVSKYSDGIKSSHSQALTKYDVHNLLSDASPSKVWYSLESRIAVYQCRFGSRLVSFSHSPSGWRISSLRQCWMVRSSGKLLVSRRASFYEESLSVTSPYRTVVMFRSAGQNHYLPLE